MITEYDLQEAIAECEGQRNPSMNTCIKLASLYFLKDKKFPEEKMTQLSEIPMRSYSYSGEPIMDRIMYDKSDTEFVQTINGMDTDDFIKVMDELMTTINTLVPKLYDGVMRKLSANK